MHLRDGWCEELGVVLRTLGHRYSQAEVEEMIKIADKCEEAVMVLMMVVVVVVMMKVVKVVVV